MQAGSRCRSDGTRSHGQTRTDAHGGATPCHDHTHNDQDHGNKYIYRNIHTPNASLSKTRGYDLAI